jgi:hypothetical protein
VKAFMRLVLAAAVFLAVPQFALGQGLNIMRPTGPYTQAPTGMVFPESVGTFRRINVILYKPDGSDASAGYDEFTPMHEINMTVYVFPSPPVTGTTSATDAAQSPQDEACRRQYQGVLREVVTAHPDAVPVEQHEIQHPANGVTYNGRVMTVDYTGAHYAGRANVALRSQAYFFCNVSGKWSVEYRVDYPRDFDASALIAGFINDLQWTIPPEQK